MVTNPTALTYARAAGQTPGVTAARAEDVKIASYASRSLPKVTPVGIETFGRPGPSAEKLISELAMRRAGQSGKPYSKAKAEMRATFSAVLVTANARMLYAAQKRAVELMWARAEPLQLMMA